VPADRAPSSGPFLHIANGHSTTATIARAGIPGTLSVWADALHDGPVPGDVDDDALLRVRARHLASGAHAVEDVTAELTRWRDAAASVAAYPEAVLWFEHDLFDQLNLIQLLDRLARTPRGGAAVSLVSIGAFPGRPDFKGMGELTPGELAPLFDTRQAIGDRHYAVAQEAWRAFRDPDPRSLERLLRTDLSVLPFLAPALHRHLDEFPSTRNGLSRSEEHLLRLIAGGEGDVWTLFPRMHEGEICLYVADTSFWSMVRGLASASTPLLEMHMVPDEPGALPRGRLSITAAGEDVLEGRTDRIARCGIDRWLGGVHVTAANPWRRDPATRQLIRR
jgi:hypothetical protein